MKIFTTKLGFILLLGFIVVTGCREFDEIIVNVDGTKVSFTLPDSELNNDTRYILYDIAVADDQCEKDCIYWEVVRQDEPAKPYEKYFIQFPVEYGQALYDMQVRQSKPIRKGQYSVVATIAVVKDNSIVASKSVHKKFSLD